MCLCESNKEELLLNGAAGSISRQRKMSPFAKMDAEEEMNDTREMNMDLASKPYDVPVEQIILVNESLGSPHNPVPLFLHYGFNRVRETSEIASGSDFKYVYITVFFSDYIYLTHVMY
jgi:hypothetical protein